MFDEVGTEQLQLPASFHRVRIIVPISQPIQSLVPMMMRLIISI